MKRQGGANQRVAQMMGWLTNDSDHPVMENPPSEKYSKYNQVKWKFLLFAPFSVGSRCCNVMKKDPAHRYAKETGRKPIVASLASESRLRTQKWLQNGCNAFDNKAPVSNPMSFWTDNDVLQYIYEHKLPIASVYGDVVTVPSQISLVPDENKVEYGTTGVSRTGCVFCGFGCHLERGEGRFEKLKKSHPQLYDYIMRPKEQGGLNYKEVIDWLNEHGNTGIKY